MTILVSEVNEFGIVFAADRNITYFNEVTTTYQLHSASPRKKLVPVRGKGAGRLGLVVGYFGLAEIPQIKGRSIWTRKLIEEAAESCQGNTIDDLCNELSKHVQLALDDSSLPVSKRGIGFHLGSFVEANGRYFPTFQYLSNLTRDNNIDLPTVREGGKLNSPGDDHFLGRDAKDYGPEHLDEYFKQHGPRIYFNGMTVLHNMVLKITREIAPLIQKVKDTYGQYEVELRGFGSLKSIEDHKRFVQLTTMITRDFYATYSAHPGKPIGGDIDIITIDTIRGLEESTIRC